MADAGKIMIMPKGAYDASASYEVLDLVVHDSKAWVARRNVIGVEPSEANSDDWFLMIDNTSLDNILDGTVTVGNSKKLDGKSASELSVADADTVDGYHANDFIGATLYPISTDCNEDIASNDKKVRIRRYTGDTLNSPYKEGATTYSQGIIITYPFSNSFGLQFAFGGDRIYSRRQVSGSCNAWTSYAPLTGATFTDKLVIQKASPSLDLSATDSNRTARTAMGSTGLMNLLNMADSNNYNALYIRKETDSLDIALQVIRKVNGTASTYNVLHTGNSTKVVIQETAPSDTATLWVW